MRKLGRLSKITRFSGSLYAVGLLLAGSAWAGDGGSNLATLQSFLNGFCNSLNVTCPQLPTITQAALEIGAQFNVASDTIRFRDNSGFALVTASPPLESGKSPLDLSTSTPFASVSASTVSGQASATRLDDNTANAFAYVVTSIGPNAQPDTVHFVLEDLFRTGTGAGQVTLGQNLAHMSLYLTVMNSGVETVVPTTLDFVATCSGTFANCVTNANATGNFSGKGTSTLTADKIGLTATSSFAASLISSVPHLAIQVDVPLIVNPATDPLYLPLLQNPPILSVNPFLPSGFEGPQNGFTPAKSNVLSSKTASIGIAPFAAPLCPGNANCSTNPPEPGVFGFCASLPDNNANLLPAVAAFTAVATSGEMLVSAPVGSSSKIVCP